MADVKTEAKLDTRVGALHDQNNQTLNDINSLGGAVDLSTARFEHLMKWLVSEGVITNMGRLEEQESWELKLREQLKPIKENLKEELRRRAAAQREQARRAGHDVKQESGIILPGAGKKI